MKHNILIIDDEPLQRRMLEIIVEHELDYGVITTSSSKKATELISTDGDHSPIDLVLLDISMPNIDGMALLKKIKPMKPDLPFIIITGHDDLKTAIEAMKAGASDFILKHEPEERIQLAIKNALQSSVLRNEVSRLKREKSGQVHFEDIIGDSKLMEETKIIARRAAESEISVLIKGESGVGKELFAQAIHGTSRRAEKPFVAINCGAIPDNLIESTLFGHEKGSFTGAINKALGKFREAEGGTLFLDEVGELTPEMQIKLLRAVQEREVQPVGATSPVKVNVRIISATNKNLKKEMNKGNFREDLYYRLNVFPLTIPPLNKRGEKDLDALVEYFQRRIAAKEGKIIRGISEEAKQVLFLYDWPGNVRQLENIISRAIVICEGEMLEIEHFSSVVKALAEQGNKKAGGNIFPISGGRMSLSLLNSKNHFRKMDNIEGEIIQSALEFYNWRMSEVARRLGIGRSTLYRKMHSMGITHPNSERKSGNVA